MGQENGLPYLVADFVRGTNLEDLLSVRRAAPRRAAGLLATVPDALDYAHRKGVVHRDAKPSNIMLDDDGTPRLMGFGLAKRDAGEITMTIEELVLGGLLVHGGNPALRWMASNVALETDAADNWKPSKKRSIERIDGIVALVMALDGATTGADAGSSVYETPESLAL